MGSREQLRSSLHVTKMLSDRAESLSQGVLFPKSVPLTTMSQLLGRVEDTENEAVVYSSDAVPQQSCRRWPSARVPYFCVRCGQRAFRCETVQTGNTGPPGQLLWNELIHPIKWFDSVKQPVSLTIYLTWLIGCLDKWTGSQLFGGSRDTAFVGSNATDVMLSGIIKFFL